MVQTVYPIKFKMCNLNNTKTDMTRSEPVIRVLPGPGNLFILNTQNYTQPSSVTLKQKK